MGRTPFGPQESPAGRRKVPPVSGRAQKPSRVGARVPVDLESLSLGTRELGSPRLQARRKDGEAQNFLQPPARPPARPPLGFSRYPLSWDAQVPIHALGALSGALSALASLPRQLSVSAAGTPVCDADAAGATTLDTGHALVLGYFPRQLALSVSAPAAQSHILLLYASVTDSVCRSDFLSGFWFQCICTILASVSLSFYLLRSFLSCHRIADVLFLSFVSRAVFLSFCV